MCPMFDNIEEIMPKDIFNKLEEMHQALKIYNLPTKCIHCGSQISHKWIYSADGWCQFVMYCVNYNCEWIAASSGFDSNCPELL